MHTLRFDGCEPTALKAKTISVGRTSDNDIQLDHESVSSHHARLRLQEGQYVLEDLGSTNGTEVNGQRITQVRLVNNARIRLGAFEATYTGDISPIPTLACSMAERPERDQRSIPPTEPPVGETYQVARSRRNLRPLRLILIFLIVVAVTLGPFAIYRRLRQTSIPSPSTGVLVSEERTGVRASDPKVDQLTTAKAQSRWDQDRLLRLARKHNLISNFYEDWNEFQKREATDAMKTIVLRSEALFSGSSDDENLGSFVELLPGIGELKIREIQSISETMVAVMQTGRFTSKEFVPIYRDVYGKFYSQSQNAATATSQVKNVITSALAVVRGAERDGQHIELKEAIKFIVELQMDSR